MKSALREVIRSKRGLYIISVIVLILFSLSLNIAFSIFASKTTKNIANIKVNDMNYAVTINGVPGTIIKANTNNLTIANLVITSLNDIDSKYELIYKVCSDSSCSSYIQTPVGLKVEYSSRTADSITGEITASGTKSIRIVITNEIGSDIYIQLEMNAGYTHNTLEILGLIVNEYNEEDLTIAAHINGELSTTFPTTSGYTATVECTVDGEQATGVGTASWDGTKWKVNINDVTTGRTYCNVYFIAKQTFANTIVNSYGGTEAIIELPVSAFSSVETGAGGLYKTQDDYGTSYYFRGDHNLPNNVIFAGYQWKIIRIDGKGSIRMIYNGTCPENSCIINGNEAGEATQLSSTSIFNTNSNDNAYVGYMYGLTGQSTYTLTHTNTNSSIIKQQVDDFYNGLPQNAKEKIAQTEYCADRQSSTSSSTLNGGGGFGTTTTYYGTYIRLQTNKTPSLKCTNANDRLNLKAGLITADEVAYAGGAYGINHINSSFYLRTNQPYWTMSPGHLSLGIANAWYLIRDGFMFSSLINFALGIRPVLSLVPETIITSGDGSLSSPYIFE